LAMPTRKRLWALNASSSPSLSMGVKLQGGSTFSNKGPNKTTIQTNGLNKMTVHHVWGIA
jgi:hypothetical protein